MEVSNNGPAAASPRQEQQQQVAETSTAASVRGSDGICDMCLAVDGANGFRLLQCRVCHVRVHDECYGHPPTHQSDASGCGDASSSFWFTCWACQAVDSVVKFRERDPDSNERLQYVVHERPTECCLCSVDDGMSIPHAMHPLFDDYGEKARQIRLAPSTKGSVLGKRFNNNNNTCTTCTTSLPARPAWIHTLCGMALSTSKAGGFVYGCSKDGDYGGEADDEEEDDPQRLVWDDAVSVNSALANDDDDDENHYLHHFVWTNEKWYGSKHVTIKIRKRNAT